MVAAVVKLICVLLCMCTHMQASTITVVGPDVLTTCATAGQISINETYMIGVGGACNPFPEWPSLESFSMDEICLLRELRGDESRMCAEATTDGATQMEGTMATSYSDMSIDTTTSVTGVEVTVGMNITTVTVDRVTTLPVGNSEVPVSVPSLLSLTITLLYASMVAA